MNAKQQAMFMIGVALFVMAGILIYVSQSSPGVYTETATVQQEVASQKASESVNSKVVASDEETTSAPKTEKTVIYPINLNTATVDELVTVRGIGESRASAIIEYREYLGGYTSVEQIKEIRGIGESTYSKLAPYLTV